MFGRLFKRNLLAAIFWLPVVPTQAYALDAKAILDKVDDMWRGVSSKATFRMEVKTANWQRSLVLTGTTLGKEYSLVVIDEPKKEAGISTLKVKNEIWNYLPKSDRVIKIPSSMMMSSWMGSHFTNDDLVKESRLSDDYDYSITFDGMRNQIKTYEITLIPKPKAPVVWGKIVAEVIQEKDDYLPQRQFFYDEKGNMAREGTFSDYKTMSGKKLAATMTMIPYEKGKAKNEFTKMELKKIEFNVSGITNDFFSLKTLTKR